MTYDEKDPYFREGDGAYDSYLNSPILMASMFEMVGQVNIPKDFNNSNFNDVETSQKAKFLDVKLENNTATNNGSNIIMDANTSFVLNTNVVLSFFKSWKTIKLTGTNVNVSITIKNSNNEIIETINNGEDLTEYNIDVDNIKITINANNSCTINNIMLEVNTKKHDNNAGIKIPQEQIIGLNEWENNKNQQINNIDQNKVPITRKINNKPLSSDISLTNDDIGSQPKITTESQTVTLKVADFIENIVIDTTSHKGTFWYNLGYYENYNGYGGPSPNNKTPPIFTKNPIAIKKISFSGASLIGNWIRVAHVRYGYNSICISAKITFGGSMAALQNFSKNPLTMTIECYVI